MRYLDRSRSMPGALRAALTLATACSTAGPGPVGEFAPRPVGSRPATASTAGVPGGVDLAALQRSIAEREYRVSENIRGLQAPNRRHRLRSYFDAAGVRVHDRMDADEAPLMALELRALMRDTPSRNWDRPTAIEDAVDGPWDSGVTDLALDWGFGHLRPFATC